MKPKTWLLILVVLTLLVAPTTAQTLPQYRNVGQLHDEINISEENVLYAEVYDAEGLVKAWLSTNESGEWVDYNYTNNVWELNFTPVANPFAGESDPVLLPAYHLNPPYKLITYSSGVWKLYESYDAVNWNFVKSIDVPDGETPQDAFFNETGWLYVYTSDNDLRTRLYIAPPDDWTNLQLYGLIRDGVSDCGIWYDAETGYVYLYYQNGTGATTTEVGLMVSPDGKTNWTDYGTIITASWGIGDTHILKIDDTYYMFMDREIEHPYYYISVFVSKDLVNWTLIKEYVTEREGGDATVFYIPELEKFVMYVESPDTGVGYMVSDGQLPNVKYKLADYGLNTGRVLISDYHWAKELNGTAGQWVWVNFTWRNFKITKTTVVGWKINIEDSEGNVVSTPVLSFTYRNPYEGITEYMSFPITTVPTEHAVYKIEIVGNTWKIYNVSGGLEATGTNDNFWNIVNSTGADIRVYNDSWKELYFYIESWDYSNQKATIWVNLTQGSKELNIMYGIPNATPSTYNDPTKVFWFFKNFEDGTTQGLTVTAGTFSAVAVANSLDPSSNYVLENQDTSTGNRRGYWEANLNGSFVLELQWQRGSTATGGAVGVFIKNGDVGYRFGYEETGDLSIKRIDSYSQGTLTDLILKSGTADTNWHNVKIIYDNGQMTLNMDGAVATVTDTTYSPPFDVGVWCGDAKHKWDNFKAYKLADPADFGEGVVVTKMPKAYVQDVKPIIHLKTGVCLDIDWYSEEYTLSELTFKIDLNNDGIFDITTYGEDYICLGFIQPKTYKIYVEVVAPDGNKTSYTKTIQITYPRPIIGATNTLDAFGKVIWADKGGSLANVTIKPIKTSQSTFTVIVHHEDIYANETGEEILNVTFVGLAGGDKIWLNETVARARTVDLLHNGEPLMVAIPVENNSVNLTLTMFSTYTLVVNNTVTPPKIAPPEEMTIEELLIFVGIAVGLIAVVAGAIYLAKRTKAKTLARMESEFKFFRRLK